MEKKSEISNENINEIRDAINEINVNISRISSTISEKLDKISQMSHFDEIHHMIEGISNFYLKKEFEKEYGDQVWDYMPNAEEIFKKYCLDKKK